MTSADRLRREIKIMQRAINPKPGAWKTQSEEIQQLLKEYETLTTEEKAAQNAETLREYENGELE